MFNRKQAKSIGKVKLNDINALSNWLLNEAGIHYIENNWSEARAGAEWDPVNAIGFYNYQSVIPFFHDANVLYDKTWCHHRLEELIETQKYLLSIGQTFDLLYEDEKKRFAVFCSNDSVYLLPENFLSIEQHKSYDNISISQIKSIGGESMTGIVPAGSIDDITVNTVKSDINKKKEAIEDTKNQIKQLEKEKEEKLEELKRQLELMYKDKFDLIEKKKAELEEMKESLNKQLYVLETEIYGIRCYTGEIINFTQLANGNSAPEETPIIVYQKVRYLDEEMGKYLALYDFDGEDIKYFEDAIRYREDLRDLFAPKDKSVSLVKISKTGSGYCSNDKIANALRYYEKYHGHTIGIIIRDGENVLMGWTDEEKISISDGNMFYEPKRKLVESSDEEYVSFSSTEEMVSRYFIYAILQGIIDSKKLLRIPEKVSMMKPSPYIVFSVADGWLEDNRFGTFTDIVKKTDLPLKKDDHVLTVMRITRDDIHERLSNGSSRQYEAYNNDRGRGEKNRTSDVSLANKTVYPINLIDRYDYYNVYSKKYPYKAIEHKTKITENSWSCNYTYEPINEEPTIKRHQLVVENGKLGWKKINGMTPEEMEELVIKDNYFDFGKIYLDHTNEKGYREEFDHIEFSHTEEKTFISEEKGDRWSDTKARANMEICKNEYLNLTFLNTVWVTYAITNRKMGSWEIGRTTVDYAASISYLNKALEYLKEREKEESALLSRYMELYPDWQVDLSEWKIKNDIHKLTDTRAKKFAKENKK